MIIYEIKKVNNSLYYTYWNCKTSFFLYIIRKELVFIYAKKYKKQDYLVSKTVILIQKTLHFVFYQKHAKKIEKPLALI